eukprot:12028416-Ditylum_brightwellii.AAC.1
MRIAKVLLRKAIQLVSTKRPLIKFKVEEGVTDKKLGESRMYKLCIHPKEEKSPVYSLTLEVFELGSPEEWLIFKMHMKQLLKGQNVTNVNDLYTFIQYLLRGDTLTAFNSKQATFDKQSPENLEHHLPKQGLHVPEEKPVFATRNASQKNLRKAAQLIRATPREEGSAEPNAKLAKRLAMTGDKILHDSTPMAEDITIASTMGIATTPQKSAGLPSI